jgi:hypothetical protein
VKTLAMSRAIALSTAKTSVRSEPPSSGAFHQPRMKSATRLAGIAASDVKKMLEWFACRFFHGEFSLPFAL